MGGSPTTAAQGKIMVATLNFSGICLSPFEYHDCTVEKDFISDKFKKIMDIETSNEDFVWNVGKIDQKAQKERYTPIYRKEAGVEKDKLVNKEQFMQLWDQQFEKALPLLKDNKPNNEQIKSCRLFDWISYRTFVNVVYQKNPKEITPIENFKNFNPKPYLQFLAEWHSKSYLFNVPKMKRVAKFLKDLQIDVMFLQESVDKETIKWESLVSDEFGIVRGTDTDSMILYRKTKFPEDEDRVFRDKYAKILNWNKDSVFIKKGNHLLISVHLTSKSHNVEQAKEMFNNIKTIRQQNPKIQIVIGTDSNHFLDPALYPGFQFVPDQERFSTTSKKRTWVQLQTSKANVIVMETKDHIVSTRKVKKYFIGMLDGEKVNEKLYLPCDIHPYDHFVIVAELI